MEEELYLATSENVLLHLLHAIAYKNYLTLPMVSTSQLTDKAPEQNESGHALNAVSFAVHQDIFLFLGEVLILNSVSSLLRHSYNIEDGTHIYEVDGFVFDIVGINVVPNHIVGVLPQLFDGFFSPAEYVFEHLYYPIQNALARCAQAQ